MAYEPFTEDFNPNSELYKRAIMGTSKATDLGAQDPEALFARTYGRRPSNTPDDMNLAKNIGLDLSSAFGTPSSVTGNVPPKLVSSSQNIRNEVNNLKTGITNLEQNPMNLQMQSILDSIMNPQAANTGDIDALEKMRQGINAPFQQTELTQIEQAGQAAGAQYDPLIARAEEEKRKGMPKAVIAAGERGGFMNTQFAGRAALQATEGGDFVGAGGELESIKSAYDLNISDLQSRKAAAIEDAKASMSKFIRTGRAQDLDAAQKNYQLAQQAADRQFQQNQDKLNAVIKWNQVQAEMNKPVLQAEAAVQDFALESMEKYTSGFTDLSPQELASLTLRDIQERILNSQEYKDELQAASKKEQADANKLSGPASYQEFTLMQREGYKGSYMDYQKLKATQYGTEKSGGGGSTGTIPKGANQPVKSFEDYLNETQNELRMTLSEPARADLKKQYDAEVKDYKQSIYGSSWSEAKLNMMGQYPKESEWQIHTRLEALGFKKPKSSGSSSDDEFDSLGEGE